MAISYVTGSTGTNTIALTTGLQAGDLAVIFAFRDGSTTAPTTASGWTSFDTVGANLCSFRTSYYVVPAGQTNVPASTWTNATSVVLQVYRGAAGLGGFQKAGNSGTAILYSEVILQNVTGTSWVACFAGHRQTNGALNTPRSDQVLRQYVTDATDQAAGFDSNAGAVVWSAQTVQIGGTSSGWLTSSVELLAADAAVLPIRLGTTQVTKAYLGTTPITRIYLGTTRIMRDRRLHRPRLMDRRRPLRRAA